MAKKMKMKMKRKTAPVVPKDLKPFVMKKFKSKDRSLRVMVVRLPKEQGYNVQAVSAKTLTVVRDFSVPLSGMSELPTTVWLPVQRELAIWFARTLARTRQQPDPDQENRRRRREMKKALAAYQSHMATKQVVQQLKGTGPKPLLRKKPQILLPYLCFYNPLARKKDAVFHIHTAYCSRLDQVRKRFHKKGGDSWVIEATGPQQAIALQVAEFEEEQKGYDAGDFEIHECAGRPKLVTGKTTLGRIMKTKRSAK